jgi:hypothetical protein
VVTSIGRARRASKVKIPAPVTSSSGSPTSATLSAVRCCWVLGSPAGLVFTNAITE